MKLIMNKELFSRWVVPCMVFLLLWLVPLTLTAQQQQQKLRFSIANFAPDPFDQTATNPEFEKIDGSGARYAIVKVTSDNPEDDLRAFQFNFGNLRHEVTEHDGELWVYVQKNAKMVTIRRDGYITINKYDLRTTIEAGKVYVMQLSVAPTKVKHRILQFKVTPANESAIVKVKRDGDNGAYELWGTVDATGSIARRLEVGIYDYEITAAHYDKSVGRVHLTYADENLVEPVTLTPNFGYLEVLDEQGIAGAEIYVDDKKIGNVPYTAKEPWDVREDYQIMISNGELYKTYNGTFAIKKGETTRLSPTLEANFAQTTITVANHAEILIEGTSRGHGEWKGPLRAGIYIVECRIDKRYRPTRKQITVKPNIAETFVMDAPIPITGGIYVNSNPLGASVLLDDKYMGQTPCELKDVIVGQHNLTLKLNKYSPFTQNIEIRESETTEVEQKLTLISDIKQKTKEAKKEQKAEKADKYAQVQTERGGASNQFPLYHKRTCGYVLAGAQIGSLIGVGITAGAYIKNINVEANFIFGFAKSEEIKWEIKWSSYGPFTYKPLSFGFKAGYGFCVAKQRLRLTPQVGIQVVSIRASAKGEFSNGYVVPAAIGLRADYAFTRHFGIYLAPEFDIAIKKSSIYDQLSDVSSKIKGWGTGFNARLGFRYSF